MKLLSWTIKLEEMSVEWDQIVGNIGPVNEHMYLVTICAALDYASLLITTCVHGIIRLTIVNDVF